MERAQLLNKLAKALELSGYKVGLYTSPHLISFNERISVNSVPISDNDADRLEWSTMLAFESLNNREHVIFDIITIMAFRYFYEQKVDYAVIEVGVGGAKDSTNIIEKSEVGVITSVGLDHVAVLGNTHEEIAVQKMGIWRQDTPFVVGPDWPQQFMKEYLLNTMGAKDDFLHFIPKLEHSEQDYNKENERIVRKVIEVLNHKQQIIDPSVIDEALQSSMRGRLEQFNDRIIYDGAHNQHGVDKALTTFMNKYWPNENDTFILVLGFVKKHNVIPNLNAVLSHPQFAKIKAVVFVSCHGDSERFGNYKKEWMHVKNIVKKAENLNLTDTFRIISRDIESSTFKLLPISEVFNQEFDNSTIVNDFPTSIKFIEDYEEFEGQKIFVMGSLMLYQHIYAYFDQSSMEE